MFKVIEHHLVQSNRCGRTDRLMMISIYSKTLFVRAKSERGIKLSGFCLNLFTENSWKSVTYVKWVMDSFGAWPVSPILISSSFKDSVLQAASWFWDEKKASFFEQKKIPYNLLHFKSSRYHNILLSTYFHRTLYSYMLISFNA